MEGQDPAVKGHSPLKNSSNRPPCFIGPASSLGVPPLLSGTKEREGPSATAGGRVAVQPSVCGIQPGQMLSLRTPFGLEKSREVFVAQQKHLWQERQYQQQQQQAKQKHCYQELHLGQRSSKEMSAATKSSTGGQRRYCRLQPLGVVDGEVLKPEEVLGVVPMTFSRKDEDYRPKSSSAPRKLHCNERSTTEAKTKHRKRSYSAILSREFSGEELGQLLFISRHVALVPQDEGKSGQNQSHLDPLRGNLVGPLPSVYRKREIGKMRSLRHTKKVSPKDKKSQELVTVGTDGTPQVDKLPPITGDPKLPPTTGDPTQIINIKITSPHTPTKDSATEDNTGAKPTSSTQKADDSAAESASLPLRISPRIVSLGEARGLDRSVAGVKSKLHPSSGVKGRLSHGWSSPQPIQGLRGSPIYIPTTTSKEVGMAKSRGGKERKKEAEVDVRSSTPGMTININVNDFLGPEHSEHSISQGDELKL